MSFLAVIATGTFLLAAFSPQNAAVLVGVIATILLALLMLGKRNGVLMAPLAIGAPLMAHFVSLTAPARWGILGVSWALLLWCFSDMRARARGAPLVRERIELFFFAGSFTLFVVAFMGAASFSVSVPLLLGGVGLLGALAVAVLRLLAEQVRAVPPHPVPIALDAVVAGLFLVEIFVALSFLPLSSLALAAILTVFAWALSTLFALSRSAMLNAQAVLRVGFLVTGITAALIATISLNAII
ncbi:MAG: hypothetical protein HY475_01120 [Candidatus Terrybacteria bacterium]|nr:hypothetical protein [Candidatus Terrybacteria bacterium]